MNCENCVFYVESLKTCMFCDFIDKNKVENHSANACKSCTACIGEWVDENHFIPSCDNTPRCEGQEKEWDILKLSDESDFCDEWTHKKILKRLHNHGVDCFFVDMWGCDEIAFISGVNSSEEKVARVLGIHKECVYYDFEHDFMILNLFQEKYMRGLL